MKKLWLKSEEETKVQNKFMEKNNKKSASIYLFEIALNLRKMPYKNGLELSNKHNETYQIIINWIRLLAQLLFSI